jgi:hypothetical protein
VSLTKLIDTRVNAETAWYIRNLKAPHLHAGLLK